MVRPTASSPTTWGRPGSLSMGATVASCSGWSTMSLGASRWTRIPASSRSASAGGLYDRHTGLVRFGARDYDAAIGRWMTKDSNGFAGRSSNLYAYADSDPVNLMDSKGKAVTSGGLCLAALTAAFAGSYGGAAAGCASACWGSCDFGGCFSECLGNPADIL